MAFRVQLSWASGTSFNCLLDPCSGHRIGTAEVESALVSHPNCVEAAVVGFDHEVNNLVSTYCRMWLSFLLSLPVSVATNLRVYSYFLNSVI